VYSIRQEQERLSRNLIDVLQGLVDKYSLIEEARNQQGHNLTRVKMNVMSVEPKQKQNVCFVSLLARYSLFAEIPQN